MVGQRKRPRLTSCVVLPSPSPHAETENRLRAVRAVRIFLPVYSVAALTLTLPVVTRLAQIDAPVLSLLATVSMAGMAVAAPTFLAWLAKLGQYHRRTGLEFRLGPAMFRGTYVPVRGPPPGSTLRSPLGSLHADAQTAAADLEAAGLDTVAQALRAAVQEAEILHLALQRPGASEAPGPVIREAESQLTQLRELVARLQGDGRVSPEPVRESLESLLGGLRRAGETLRTR